MDVNSSNFSSLMKDFSKLLIDEISKIIPDTHSEISGLNVLHSAMRYSTLSDAKHLRPFLTFATSQIFNINIQRILPVCVAIELIHVYSLVHDDLPAMDNDDYRRGNLSCHKKFSEAVAILTGDSLLTLAFELLSKLNESSNINCKMIQILTEYSGYQGMIGGQLLDIFQKKHDLAEIKTIHLMKTAKLFSSSCMLGGIMGNATEKEISILKKYGENIGCAFQVQDDITDIENGVLENNIVRIIGIEKAKKYMKELFLHSKELLKNFSNDPTILIMFTNFLEERI